MYPLIRFTGEVLKNRRKPMTLDETHISNHRCWPWDLDPWMELNNGRTLTLYDLGRVPFIIRAGMDKTLARLNWRFTVAGVSVRYRRRITAFEKVTISTRIAGWDDRFFYFDQSIWRKDGECANQVLVRSALVGPSGIASPEVFVREHGFTGERPVLPDWIKNWVDAESTRPWPPEKSPLD
jgi:acyl-CoA thioesterase FadM